MAPRKKAQVAFASAVMLLFLSGLAASFTINRLLESENWVIHTLEVKAALGDVESAFVRAGRARSGYVISGTEDFLREFEAAAPQIHGKIQRLRELTRDNPKQLQLCSRLEDAIDRRVVLWQESVQVKEQTPENQAAQAEFDRRSIPLSSEITSLMEQMRANEESLFDIRQNATHSLFILVVATLAVAFILALELLAVHYRLLSAELKAREEAEQTARDGQESLRRLTGRLLQLQDAERRKFSRELHDSLGQYLAGAKMNLEMFASQLKPNLLDEAVQLLDQSIAETRTISHLLHPPLLDEAGFSSAAKWYLEGFAQRSGIAVKLDLPEGASRLPRPVALGLFRVLQESLTNIHRHANSARAEVALELFPERVLLRIRDYGRGIAPELVENLRSIGTSAGVGLAGMRERVRELGGQFKIELCSPGTAIVVALPLPGSAEETTDAAAD
jgi:signal transduction histidine kinase